MELGDGVPVGLDVELGDGVPVELDVELGDGVPVGLDVELGDGAAVRLGVALGNSVTVALGVALVEGESEVDLLGVLVGLGCGVADHENDGPPVTSTRRRMFMKSATTTRPHDDAVATPEGRFSTALMAGPVSPPKPPLLVPIAPLPAIVLMTREPAATTRMR